MRLAHGIVALFAVATCCADEIPADIATFDDGRGRIHDLYESFNSLAARGWSVDVIIESQPDGTDIALPVLAFRSPVSGPATWIISGIHGEEPAGPNAIARTIDSIAAYGEENPVVLIPLANPHGYVRNWRYLNAAEWAEDIEVQSVGDSSHLLIDRSSGRARTAAPANAEADALTRFILGNLQTYPVLVSLDLHEDNLIDEGYVYSQGIEGRDDPVAAAAIAILRESGVSIKAGGVTRFDEEIVDGIIGPVVDSSIDEFMSASEIVVDGERRAGPAAHTVLVFETPAAALPIEQRIEAHAALLTNLLSSGDWSTRTAAMEDRTAGLIDRHPVETQDVVVAER